eukprot:1157359-Alexandrium_andersonii.AAC.1
MAWRGPPALLNLAAPAWRKIERRLASREGGRRPAVDALAAKLAVDVANGHQIDRRSTYEAVWLAAHE